MIYSMTINRIVRSEVADGDGNDASVLHNSWDIKKRGFPSVGCLSCELFVMCDVLLPWHYSYVSVERVGYGLEDIEAEVIFAELYPRDVWAFDSGLIADVLLRHASLLAQVGNLVPYANALLFDVHSSSVIS